MNATIQSSHSAVSVVDHTGPPRGYEQLYSSTQLERPVITRFGGVAEEDGLLTNEVEVLEEKRTVGAGTLRGVRVGVHRTVAGSVRAECESVLATSEAAVGPVGTMPSAITHTWSALASRSAV